MLKKWLLCTACVILTDSTSAFAQDLAVPPTPTKSAESTKESRDSRQLGDVVVVAQRRAERLQDVPVAVTAVEGLALAKASALQSTDIKLVSSSANVMETAGYVAPYIRGIGSRAIGPGIESPVATYVDGVYVGSATSALVSFSNVERIEVLAGPQGTLFGRNATGGLIQVITRDPKSDFDAEFNAGYGAYHTMTGNAYVTGAIAPGVAADISAVATVQGSGYGKNLYNGQDVYKTDHNFGLRSKWLLEPADWLTLRFVADYGQFKSSQYAQRLAFGTTYPPPFGPNYGGSPWTVDLSTQPYVKNRQGGVSLQANADLGALTLTSITAYRRSRFEINYDADVSGAIGRDYLAFQADSQFSQELQLLSPAGSPLSWTAGLFFWHQDSRYDPFTLTFAGVQSSPFFNRITGDPGQKTNSIAPYLQGTYEVLPDTRLTLGIRYTNERREFTGSTMVLTAAGARVGPTSFPVFSHTKASRFTYRASLDHRFTDNVMAYVSYNTGFKSGGFSPQTLNAPPYKPESLTAYEVGLKSTLLERRLRLNAAAFHYDYTNVQVYGVTGNTLFVGNGGKARDNGLELQITALPIPSLTINAGYTYLDTKWLVYPNAQVNVPNASGGKRQIIGDVAGKELPFAPHHVLSFSSSYSHALGPNMMTLNVGAYYNSGYFGEPDNVARQGGYTLFNASLRLAAPEDRFSVSLWGRNLGNTAVNIYPSHTPETGGLSVERATYAAPRTYGVTLGARF